MGFISSSLAVLVFLTMGPFQQGAALIPACQKGWDYINGHCYGLFIKPVPWHEAEMKCQSYSKSGHLVSIVNKQEQVMVAAWLTSLKYYSTVWIGLYSVGKSRNYNQAWWWIDDSPFEYSAWGAGEPDYPKGLNYFCAQFSPLKGLWKWDDTDCDIINAFICKYKL